MAETKAPSKFAFLKTKKFWFTVIHVAVIAGGCAASAATGTPIPLVITGGINALISSPLDKTPSISDAKTLIGDVEKLSK